MHPPLERCRYCGGPTRFHPVSGRGTIYSFIVVRYAVTPGFAEQLPYNVALVELEEQVGLRLPLQAATDITDTPLNVGDQVVVELEDHPGGTFKVPVYRPTLSGEVGDRRPIA